MNKTTLFSLISLFCSAFASEHPSVFPRPIPKPGLRLNMYNKTDLTAVVTTDTCTEIPAHSRKNTFMPMLAQDTDLLDVIASVQLRHDDEEATTIDCSYAGSTGDTDNTDTHSFKNGLVYRMMIQYQESDNTCSFTLTGTPVVLPM
jgi:hypothetical protein